MGKHAHTHTEVTTKLGRGVRASWPCQAKRRISEHGTVLTIEEVDIVDILLLVHARMVLMLSLRLGRLVGDRRHVQVAEMAKVVELGIGEQSQLGIDVEITLLS